MMRDAIRLACSFVDYPSPQLTLPHLPVDIVREPDSCCVSIDVIGLHTSSFVFWVEEPNKSTASWVYSRHTTPSVFSPIVAHDKNIFISIFE